MLVTLSGFVESGSKTWTRFRTFQSFWTTSALSRRHERSPQIRPRFSPGRLSRSLRRCLNSTSCPSDNLDLVWWAGEKRGKLPSVAIMCPLLLSLPWIDRDKSLVSSLPLLQMSPSLALPALPVLQLSPLLSPRHLPKMPGKFRAGDDPSDRWTFCTFFRS